MNQLTRRQAIQLLGMSGIGYLLGSCSNEFTAKVGDLSEPLNQSVGELLVKPQLLIPEFSKMRSIPNLYCLIVMRVRRKSIPMSID